MLKLKRTYSVVVKLPEGSFTCVFKRKKQNQALADNREYLKLDKLKASEDPDVAMDAIERAYKILASNLDSIEGLADEDGTPITVQQFLDNDLYSDVVAAVIRAQTEALTKWSEGSEKK